MTLLLTLASGTLYDHFGAGGFWAMAGLCLIALPFIAKLAKANPGNSAPVSIQP
jgi:PPP family 3-phenylpropionic acid transporter